jgi:hypothetical protein
VLGGVMDVMVKERQPITASPAPIQHPNERVMGVMGKKETTT